MKIAFAIDPISTFNPEAETTFFLMEEMCRRGFSVFGFELSQLYQENHRVFAQAAKIKVTRQKNRFDYRISGHERLDLAKTSAILLRKDPPVDIAFQDHLSILETIESKTFFINSPSEIKSAGEKFLPLVFEELSPPTRISQNVGLLREFVMTHGKVVLKPLNLSGGRGIVIVKKDDPSLPSLLDLLTEQQKKYILAQKYLPAVSQGDKRVILLDGEILGAFLRVPQKNDFRGNLHSGALLKKATLTSRDKKIITTIIPELKKRHLHFVGLDIIGEWLTEINVTSPMGIREINQLTGKKIEKDFVDWMLKKMTQ